MLRTATAIALGALVCSAGCRGWRGEGDTFYRRWAPRKRAKRETTYTFGVPGDGWDPARIHRDVQVAWVHPDRSAYIELHVQCDDQGDSSLEQYTDHLRIDWTEWKVLKQTEERLVGRAALRTVVDSSLDGVPMRSELLVVKKNGCLFDLRYVSEPATFDSGRGAFETVVAGFEYPPGTR